MHLFLPSAIIVGDELWDTKQMLQENTGGNGDVGSIATEMNLFDQ